MLLCDSLYNIIIINGDVIFMTLYVWHCMLVYKLLGQGFHEAGWKSFPVLVGSSLPSDLDLNDGADACSTAVKELVN